MLTYFSSSVNGHHHSSSSSSHSFSTSPWLGICEYCSLWTAFEGDVLFNTASSPVPLRHWTHRSKTGWGLRGRVSSLLSLEIPACQLGYYGKIMCVSLASDVRSTKTLVPARQRMHLIPIRQWKWSNCRNAPPYRTTNYASSADCCRGSASSSSDTQTSRTKQRATPHLSDQNHLIRSYYPKHGPFSSTFNRFAEP